MTIITVNNEELLDYSEDYEHFSHVKLDDIPRLILGVKRDEVIEALMHETGKSRYELEYTFEDGIDSWFGFGSVMCCQLPCYVSVTQSLNDLVMIITKI